MKVLFKIVLLLLIGLSVFLLWPAKSIQPEQRILSAQKPSSQMETMVLVYNATSDHWSVLTDFFHKAVSPQTYPCNLCNLTFGVFTMKDDWKQFLDTLPYKKIFLHKDEFEKKYSMAYTNYPVIFSANQQYLWVLVSKRQIDSCDNLQQLKQVTWQNLGRS